MDIWCLSAGCRMKRRWILDEQWRTRRGRMDSCLRPAEMTEKGGDGFHGIHSKRVENRFFLDVCKKWMDSKWENLWEWTYGFPEAYPL